MHIFIQNGFGNNLKCYFKFTVSGLLINIIGLKAPIRPQQKQLTNTPSTASERGSVFKLHFPNFLTSLLTSVSEVILG
jgi:hypothetical protein